MIKVKIKVGDILLVEIPKNVEKFTIKYYGFAGAWLEEIQSERLNSWKTFLSKDGTVTRKIIGKLSQLDKELEEFVDALNSVYLDYLNPDYPKANWTDEYGCNTIRESFISLIKSQHPEFDESKEYLLIKLL